MSRGESLILLVPGARFRLTPRLILLGFCFVLGLVRQHEYRPIESGALMPIGARAPDVRELTGTHKRLVLVAGQSAQMIV